MKCPTPLLTRMVKTIVRHHHTTITDFVNAATPIVDGIVDGTLNAKDRYVIDTISTDEIARMPAGSPDLFHLLRKSLIQ